MIALIIIAAIMLLVLTALNIPMVARVTYYSGKLRVKAQYLSFTLFSLGDDESENTVDDEKDASQPKNTQESKNETLLHSLLDTEVDEDFVPQDFDSAAPGEFSSNTPPKTDNGKRAEKKAGDDSSEKKNIRESSPKRQKKSLNELLDYVLEKKEQLQLIWELCSPDLRRLFGKITIYNVIVDFDAAGDDACETALLYGKMWAAVTNALGLLTSLFRVKLKKIRINCLYNLSSDNIRYDGEAKLRLRPASLVNAVISVLCGYLINKRKYEPLIRLLFPSAGKSGKQRAAAENT